MQKELWHVDYLFLSVAPLTRCPNLFLNLIVIAKTVFFMCLYCMSILKGATSDAPQT